jgi:hypothetical protein
MMVLCFFVDNVFCAEMLASVHIYLLHEQSEPGGHIMHIMIKLKEECDNLINTKMNTGTDADGVGMFICKACEKPLHLFATRSRQVNTTESSSLDTSTDYIKRLLAS